MNFENLFYWGRGGKPYSLEGCAARGKQVWILLGQTITNWFHIHVEAYICRQ